MTLLTLFKNLTNSTLTKLEEIAIQVMFILILTLGLQLSLFVKILDLAFKAKVNVRV